MILQVYNFKNPQTLDSFAKCFVIFPQEQQEKETQQTRKQESVAWFMSRKMNTT